MLGLNKIYYGNCVDVMSGCIEDNTIHLIVTSPPYHIQKDYEKKTTYDDYCAMMESFFKESQRALIGGGYLVVNFGDYFNSGNRFYTSDVPACYPAALNYFNWGVTKAGMDLQATRIWRKKFAKMGIPFVCNKAPRGIYDYEHIWTFRKKNGSKEEFVNDRKLSQRGVLGESWKSAAKIGEHCSGFPVELPEWAIKVYSKNESDIVLDPFIGGGTTAVAAKNLGRSYIGIDCCAEYCKLAMERLMTQ